MRDTWLVIGATLLMILFLEGIYRLQGVLRRATASPAAAVAPPPSPFEQTGWARDYHADQAREEAVLWSPYVYLRNPTFTGKVIATDSLGHRVTPVPRSNATRSVRLFFLGGSTTFGWYQRSDHTLPAEAARRVQELLGDSARVDVTNFGVPGRTFTQEILDLQLQLRAGARPDVVVFYDGINDVAATIQNGQAGFPQNEGNRVDDFSRGQQLRNEIAYGTGGGIRAVSRPLFALLMQLELVKRIVAVKTATPAPIPPIRSLAQDLSRIFAGNAALVEALRRYYGFEVIYVWQPALLSSHKPLTRREAWLRHNEPIAELHRAMPAVIGPAMAPVVGSRFIDATTLFDHDSLDTYVDTYGHTYERANTRVVDTLMPSLSAAVRSAMARAGATPAPARVP